MTIQLLTGDSRHVLTTLAPGSVHCIVTSPPYYGLRDYGTAKWEGGSADCDHVSKRKPPTVGSSSTLGYPADGGPRRIAEGNTYHEAYTEQYRDVCGRCGAQRGDKQIGLEETPDEYIAQMVAVFHEARRVLRDDGTLWLNIGDSYNAQPGQRKPTDKVGAKQETNAGSNSIGSRSVVGLKPKDLIGIPWMLAFALRADGWYLRQDIIWHKPNPMPESVRDRCTKAHEYVFLLSKSPRYLFDAEAIAEAAKYPGDNRAERPDTRKAVDPFCADNGSRARTGNPTGETINKRSVWSITTQPFSEAHFATMAPELARTCIMAGCPLGGTVLDPFGGAGTTGLVADQLQRNAILIELNPAYVEIARKRIDADAGMFSSRG